MPAPVLVASPASPTATTAAKPALLVSTLVAAVSVSIAIPSVSEGAIIVIVAAKVVAFTQHTLVVFFLVHLGARFLQVFLPPGVCALLAFSAVGTEPC